MLPPEVRVNTSGTNSDKGERRVLSTFTRTGLPACRPGNHPTHAQLANSSQTLREPHAGPEDKKQPLCTKVLLCRIQQVSLATALPLLLLLLRGRLPGLKPGGWLLFAAAAVRPRMVMPTKALLLPTAAAAVDAAVIV